jgi:hypothetical protein
MENRVFRVSPGLFSNGNGGNGKGAKKGIVPDYYLFTKDTLRDLLSTIKKEEEFDKKAIRCPSCFSVISWKNLRVIVPNNGSFDFICDNTECVEKYFKAGSNKE